MNRTVAILLVLAVGLAAYLFLFDLPGEEVERETEHRERHLFDFTVDEVDTLALLRRDRDIVVARHGEGWRLLAPIEEPAEASAVRDRLAQLAAAEIVRVVRDSVPESDWGIYGLESRRTGRKDIRVRLRDGRSQVVHVGNETPSGAFVYIRRQDLDRLETAERGVLQLVWSSGNGLREVELFDVADTAIVYLEVEGPKGNWAARRLDDGIWVREGVDEEVRLKRRAAIGLAHDLSTATIRGFEGRPEPDEWASYGFEPPYATFRWRDGQGREGRVDLGNDAGDQQVYARRNQGDDLLLLLPQLAEHLAAPVDSLVDRNPLRTDFTRVDSLVVQYENGARQRVERVGRDWYPRIDGELVTNDDGLELAAENLVRGLEEFQPRELWLLGGEQKPVDVLDRIGVRAAVYGPHGEYVMGLGWRGRGERHWCFVEGRRELYGVSRGLYLRFQGLGLRTGVLQP